MAHESTPVDDALVRRHVAELEQVLGVIEESSIGPSRETARRMIRLLVELYGEGLARVVRLAKSSGHNELLAAFARDELVGHLMLVHDLRVPPDDNGRDRAARRAPYLPMAPLDQKPS